MTKTVSFLKRCNGTIGKSVAQAEAKRRMIEAITLKGYLKIESMNILKELQQGNHLIIMDPNAVSPLPFLNLDKIKKAGQ